MRLKTVLIDPNGKPQPYLIPVIWVTKVALNALFRHLLSRWMP